MIFLKKKNSNLKIFFRGKGVRDATVSNFFYKESKSKKIFFFFCWGGGGGRWWVRGAIVREFL